MHKYNLESTNCSSWALPIASEITSTLLKFFGSTLLRRLKRSADMTQLTSLTILLLPYFHSTEGVGLVFLELNISRKISLHASSHPNLRNILRIQNLKKSGVSTTNYWIVSYVFWYSLRVDWMTLESWKPCNSFFKAPLNLSAHVSITKGLHHCIAFYEPTLAELWCTGQTKICLSPFSVSGDAHYDEVCRQRLKNGQWQ